MSLWPHSWVAYFAGCECAQCKRFDLRVFTRAQSPDRPHEPTIVQDEPKGVTT